MRIFSFFFILFVLSINILNSQDLDSKTLMTIGNQNISVKEFLRVYNKNINLVQDQNQKDIDYYINLYSKYKLKLIEAKELGYDLKDSYKKEFTSYKNQLSNAYTTDKEVTESLVKEAYNRTANEIKAQHILVRFQDNQDSSLAYEKIQSLRPRLINEDFLKLRRSLHDGKSIFIEDLGYFSAFKMVYEFENNAFNTLVGQTSAPFRTQFGYHVVKVLDKRPSRGEVQVAHIMISNTQKDSSLVPKIRINELHNSLIQGSSFETLAKQFSDDKSSASKGGIMNPFRSGDINSEVFVDTAFNLNEIGSISKPIQTQYGWHILKLISKSPIQPYEIIKQDLEKKVKRDSRSLIIRKKMIEKLVSKYDIFQPNLDLSSQLIIKNTKESIWVLKASKQKDVFLRIEDEIYTYETFLNFLNKNNRLQDKLKNNDEFIKKQYKTFFENKLFEYKKNNLINENEEYANILKEYEDGLLLFDIMQDKIWDKAKKDTLALKLFYDNNISKFKSKEIIIGTIFSSKNKKDLKSVVKFWKRSIDDQEIINKLNYNSQVVVLSTGEFEITDPLLPQNENFKKGISKIIEFDNNYVVIKVEDIIPSSSLTFEKIKGSVISEYQSFLESNWIEKLRNKYLIKVDNQVLKELKKSLIK
ncbi:MAG: peptidylprolyl isomerase [Flavobacteriaceae bacterium]|nr:peptidylprolyl isomerase [Flavobacteriaceae bacterium]|tara:strand:+ start:6785 stop:8713 length:1929 start_codon:yes stop_codon:yes gene_type:complete